MCWYVCGYHQRMIYLLSFFSTINKETIIAVSTKLIVSISVLCIAVPYADLTISLVSGSNLFR